MPLSRSQLVYLHDLTVASLSLGAALYLRLGDDVIEPRYLNGLIFGSPLFLCICAVTFRAFGLYRGVWRYASLPDLITITKAATLTVVIFVAVAAVFNRLEAIPRSVPAIQWLVLMFLLGGAAPCLPAAQGPPSRPAFRADQSDPCPGAAGRRRRCGRTVHPGHRQ